jgi:hypothetical protein
MDSDSTNAGGKLNLRYYIQFTQYNDKAIKLIYY